MVSKECLDEFEKIATGTPCSFLEIVHTMISKDIEEQIETESLAGPFDEEWVKQMRIKKDIKDTIGKLVLRCKG